MAFSNDIKQVTVLLHPSSEDPLSTHTSSRTSLSSSTSSSPRGDKGTAQVCPDYSSCQDNSANSSSTITAENFSCSAQTKDTSLENSATSLTECSNFRDPFNFPRQISPDSGIGAGVFGTGETARAISFLLRTLGFTIRGVCGSSRSQAMGFLRDVELPLEQTLATGRPQELLMHEKVSLVVLACEPHRVAELAKNAIGMGRHVVCAVAPGPTHDLVLDLVRTAHMYAYPTVTSVLNGLRFLPAFRAARRIIQPALVGPQQQHSTSSALIDLPQFAIGAVRSCTVQVESGLMFRTDFDWMCDSSNGGGATHTLLALYIDLLQYLLGTRFLSLSANVNKSTLPAQLPAAAVRSATRTLEAADVLAAASVNCSRPTGAAGSIRLVTADDLCSLHASAMNDVCISLCVNALAPCGCDVRNAKCATCSLKRLRRNCNCNRSPNGSSGQYCRSHHVVQVVGTRGTLKIVDSELFFSSYSASSGGGGEASFVPVPLGADSFTADERCVLQALNAVHHSEAPTLQLGGALEQLRAVRDALGGSGAAAGGGGLQAAHGLADAPRLADWLYVQCVLRAVEQSARTGRCVCLSDFDCSPLPPPLCTESPPPEPITTTVVSSRPTLTAPAPVLLRQPPPSLTQTAAVSVSGIPVANYVSGPSGVGVSSAPTAIQPPPVPARPYTYAPGTVPIGGAHLPPPLTAAPVLTAPPQVSTAGIAPPVPPVKTRTSKR